MPGGNLRREWGRPLARTAMMAGGVTALIAWIGLLIVAVFDDRTTRDSSGSIMMLGLVASTLGVGLALSIIAARSGLTVIITGVVLAVGAAAGGWAVYSAMPEAGPDAFITHRAGLAALAYGFGVIGGGLIALAPFTLPAQTHHTELSQRTRRHICVLAAAVVLLAAAALAPAMQSWAELANLEARTASENHQTTPVDVDDSDLDSAHFFAHSGEFMPTPHGLLRLDHPGDRSPQAVTMVDPLHDPTAELEAAGFLGWRGGGNDDDGERWYHRRWNWTISQEPLLSDDRSLLALTGQRADHSARWQTRVLDTATGRVAGTVSSQGGPPGQLVAVGESALVYSSNRGNEVVYRSFAGGGSWELDAEPGCSLEAAGMNSTVVAAALSCAPSPDRSEVEDHVLGIDAGTGEVVWDWVSPEGATITQENFLVAGDMLVINSRVEQRVTDGPFSARGFENNLRGIDLATGEVEWTQRRQQFGRTHTSACGGTLHMGFAPSSGEADAPATFHLAQCFADQDRIGSRMGVRTYQVNDGDRVWRSSVRLGFTPTEMDTARSWVTALPDGRVLTTTDRSLDRTRPDCRIYRMEDGKAVRIHIEGDDALPANWCHEAEVGWMHNGAVISYRTEDDGGVIVVR
ncbi:hypothetical protein [Natronoglycomyces albus]|uniref:Uncharacterized protein n=1 Tax=Natronoglycomyces albus TaxID=2811108 RepID=A0A895XV87_9ACTN|nr:hypothetical protein [Natronoglycomyces albus]QSB05558.1 hypothetical protein JQS30_01045 [Natronoglycomyces albus]